MNMLASECSSECESGWTLYLEHSFLNPNVSNGVPGFLDGDGGGSSFNDEHKQAGRAKGEDEREEEEDLSMVSDASSGPPHFNEDDVYLNESNVCFYPPTNPSTSAGGGKKVKKVKGNQSVLREQKQLPSFLDDTASSPVLNVTMNDIGAVTNVYQASNDSVQDFSQGFSTTYYDGRTSFQERFNFLQPSLSHNKLQKNQWFGGNGNETI